MNTKETISPSMPQSFRKAGLTWQGDFFCYER